MKKVLLICNTDGALYVFRRPIIDALLKEGVAVTTVSAPGPHIAALRAMGVDARTVEFPRHSISLISNFRLFLRLLREIWKADPDVVHCFAHKAAIFGAAAAKLLRVPRIFITVTGLGTLFLDRSLRSRILRSVLLFQYRLVSIAATSIFFQNPDDKRLFSGRGVAVDKMILTGGSGIDLMKLLPPSVDEVAKFRAAIFRETNVSDTGQLVCLLPARAVAEKGVAEFYTAASLLHANSPGRYLFIHTGLIDVESKGLFSSHQIADTGQRCGVHFLGYKDRFSDYLTASDVVVLPSYGEGLPMSLAEALALGKPIVTTDVPGCRQTVVHGWNGFLCSPRSGESLANAISLVSRDFCMQATHRSRTLAERFDARKVVSVTLRAYSLTDT